MYIPILSHLRYRKDNGQNILTIFHTPCVFGTHYSGTNKRWRSFSVVLTGLTSDNNRLTVRIITAYDICTLHDTMFHGQKAMPNLTL